MREIDWQLRSNRILSYICTHEEKRVLGALQDICERPGHENWSLVTWDIVGGLRSTNDDLLPTATSDRLMDQTEALRWFAQLEVPKGCFVVLALLDFLKFMGEEGGAGQIEHQVVRHLRNLSQECIGQNKALILMGTHLFLPPELDKLTAVIDWPLPEYEHIQARVTDLLQKAAARKDLAARFETTYDEASLDEIVRAFQGLTLQEVDHLCTYAMVNGSARLDPEDISRHKRDLIRKSGLLEWIEVRESLTSVGGLEELKHWLRKRQGAFSTEAQAYGLPANPKGILLIGVQGAGKSLCAQAIAAHWKLPLLRLDMGKVFSGIVGSSEENIRAVIKVAESVAPAILMIDEIDKGMSGTASSNQTDGGTASRVFGSFLTWQQEKTAPVYVVATANDISQLPPELLRKGRFDEIFFVDLPSSDDRREIFRIHLAKRGRSPEDFDMARLVRASQSCTGAEIEAAIIAGLYESFHDGQRELRTDDIVLALEETVPLAVTMQERIAQLREWAQKRARNASQPRPAAPRDHDMLARSKKEIMAAIETEEDDL